MSHQQKSELFSRRYHRKDPSLKSIGYFKRNHLASILAAVLIGFAQMLVLVQLWGYISIYTPLPKWLLSLGFQGPALHSAVFLSDALCNVVFCLPAAYLICNLKPSVLFTYLTLAIVPGFIWQYRLFFVDPTTFKNWTLFVPGVLLAVLPLPLAALATF